MKRVQQRGINKHDHRLKDPEIYLILINRAFPAEDVLNKPVDTPNSNDASADVHHIQHRLEFFLHYSCLECFAMKHSSQQPKTSKQSGLQA